MAKKRFIAGAVCPRCGAMDKITMHQEEGVQVKECVACDYTDKIDPVLNKASQNSIEELQTRVTLAAEASLPDQDEQVITIFDPNK